MPLVNCILCFLNHALLSILSQLLLKFVVYVPKMPRRVESMPSLICVNSKVFTGHTPLVIHQVGFHTQLILIEQLMNGHALEKWESTLNFVFMPMDMM